jgi:hypothetical protein
MGMGQWQVFLQDVMIEFIHSFMLPSAFHLLMNNDLAFIGIMVTVTMLRTESTIKTKNRVLPCPQELTV